METHLEATKCVQLQKEKSLSFLQKITTDDSGTNEYKAGNLPTQSSLLEACVLHKINETEDKCEAEGLTTGITIFCLPLKFSTNIESKI